MTTTATTTKTGTLYRVGTSTGAFWQTHFVRAATEEQARALAEAAANDPKLLAEEARWRADVEDAEPRTVRYAAYRCDEIEAGYDASADLLVDGETRFFDSGGEG